MGQGDREARYQKRTDDPADRAGVEMALLEFAEKHQPRFCIDWRRESNPRFRAD